MILKTPKKNSIFEGEHTYSYPSTDEMIYIFRVQEECFYYQKGIEVCRERVLSNHIKNKGNPQNVDYSKCKGVLDAYYNCTTHDYFGKTIDDLENEVRPFFKNYTKCVFTEFNHMGNCRKFFDDVLRVYFRKGDSKLKSVY